MNDVYDNIRNTNDDENDSDNDIFSVESFQSEYGIDKVNFLGINDSDLDDNDIVLTRTINNIPQDILKENELLSNNEKKQVTTLVTEPIYTILQESESDDNYDDPSKLLN